MSRCQHVGRPMLRSLCHAPSPTVAATSRATPTAVRNFSTTPSRNDETTTTTTTSSASQGAGGEVGGAGAPGGQLPIEATMPPSPPLPEKPLDPLTAIGHAVEKELMRRGTPAIGSRRRRAALLSTSNIPFDQLPYQCFQEARKILQEDRQAKINTVTQKLAKIKRIETADASVYRNGEYHKQKKLESLRQHVEKLKLLVDANDPTVKRRFEDGLGDMNKPIYRHLAERRWRQYDYKLIQQRIEQFHIVPDLLPKFDPEADVRLFFRGAKVPPGSIVPSTLTEIPPSLRVRVFDRGERLLSVVVMDADVPDPERDAYTKRCHFLAVNIPWDPTKTSLALAEIGRKAQPGAVAVPWMPPFSQKGLQYNRLAIFVLEQEGVVAVENKQPPPPPPPQQQPQEKQQPQQEQSQQEPKQQPQSQPHLLDPARLKALYDGDAAARTGFSLKSFRDKFGLRPVGFNLFRAKWDDDTADVMARHGIPGADLEFRPVRHKSLKPPRKARGWEAKRQGPKYRHLWKYTKRIA